MICLISGSALLGAKNFDLLVDLATSQGNGGIYLPRSLGFVIKDLIAMKSSAVSEMTDGAVFLDRDPDTFRLVLNYLRNKELTEINRKQMKDLCIEAKYFGLEGLEQMTMKKMKAEPHIITLNLHGDKSFKMSRNQIEMMIERFPGAEIADILLNGPRDEDGDIFVDADPKVFSMILPGALDRNFVNVAIVPFELEKIVRSTAKRLFRLESKCMGDIYIG